MAQYMMFIYTDEEASEAADPQTHASTMEAHRQFIAANGASIRGGSRLHSSSTATSLRRSAGGSVTVTDGAFAEAKEVIGGYYVVDAEDLDQALALASQIPAPFGGVEIRPLRPDS